MRKLVILLLLPLFVVSAHAAGTQQQETDPFGAGQLQSGLPEDTGELLSDFSPTQESDFAQGVVRIFENAVEENRSTLRQAMALSAVIMGVVLLCGTVSVLHPESGIQVMSLVGALGIGAACTVQFQAMIQLGAQTIRDLSDYSTLMLPALASAMVSSGAVGSAGAIYGGTVLFSQLLTVVISRILVPLVYVYIAIATVNAALDNEMLTSIRDFIAWLITGSLKVILYVYTTYITLSGIISGTADALSLKATRLAVGGMVPVVGGILSDASEALVVSASLLKNTMGVFGMLAVLGFCAAPFLRIAVHYLLLKLTKAVCGTIGRKNHVELVGCLGKAMGFLLGMTGTCCLMLLLSVVCAMKAVTA